MTWLDVQEDADTFESWGVDYVKLDGCYSHPTGTRYISAHFRTDVLADFRR